MSNQLPPLPDPIWGYSTNTPKFSAKQMHDYAKAALDQLEPAPYKVTVTGWIHETAQTAAAASLPDGEYLLYAVLKT